MLGEPIDPSGEKRPGPVRQQQAEQGRRLERQAEQLRQLQAAVTQVAQTQTAQATAGPKRDFFTRWGAWVGVLPLAAAMGGLWLSDIFSTNSRIDQIYSTLVQQTKDISQQTANIATFKDELKAAGDKIAATAAQNEELFNRIKGLMDAQAGLIAKQQALAANAQDIKPFVTKLTDTVTAQRDELMKIEDKVEKQAPGIQQKETELLEGGHVFASLDYSSALKSALGAEVDVVPIDHKVTTTFAKAIDRAIDQNRRSDSFFFFTKDAGLAASINGVLGSK
jgi:DNA repair exonuclease SbcCD ATPase subunit